MINAVDIEPSRTLEAFASIPHSAPLVLSFRELAKAKGMVAQYQETEDMLPEDYFLVSSDPKDRRGRGFRLVLMAQPDFPSTSLLFSRRIDKEGDRLVATVSLGYELVPNKFQFRGSARFSPSQTLDLGNQGNLWLLATVARVGQRVNKYIEETTVGSEPMITTIFRGADIAENFRGMVGLGR